MYITAIARAVHACDGEADLVLFENPRAPIPELQSLEWLRVVSCPGVPRNRVGRIVYQNTIYPLLMRAAHINALLATCNVLPLWTPVPGVIVVQSLQVFSHPGAFETWRKRYLRTALSSSIDRAASVICLSQFSRQALLELTGADPQKVHVVYHGLPPSHHGETSSGLCRPALPYILSVSSLHAYKNVMRVIQAYAQIRRNQQLPHRLRIIGFEAEYTSEDIKRLATELGVSDSVDFLGPIGHEDLPAQYEGADLLVYASLYETFGLPPLEAMAAGCPVVAANSTSIPEVVGDAAEMVEPLDVDAIAQGMLHVLTDSKWRAELVKRGRSRINDFTWERAGHQTLEMLRTAAGAAWE